VVESAGSEADRPCPADWNAAVAAQIAIAEDDRALELRIAILTTAIATSFHLGFREEVDEIFGGEELELLLSSDLYPLNQPEGLTDAQEQIGTIGRSETVSHAFAHDPVCQLLRRIGCKTHEEAKDFKAISLRAFLYLIHVNKTRMRHRVVTYTHP